MRAAVDLANWLGKWDKIGLLFLLFDGLLEQIKCVEQCLQWLLRHNAPDYGLAGKRVLVKKKVKPELEGKENKTYPVFEAIKYRSQVVAGTNYFIKVSISDSTNECVHLEVFQGLPPDNQEPSLIDYETGKTKEDPLNYF
ncbi:cystatin-B-like [Emydura macquarii macquarii]|uniref:cystatin-B-like n=1 Tax=Emydura macquarii macquarii TaxID=1129001 RepID=UPI00352B29AF